MSEATTQTTTAYDEHPDWTFFWMFLLFIFSVCAIPTGLFVLGAWLVRLIWGG